MFEKSKEEFCKVKILQNFFRIRRCNDKEAVMGKEFYTKLIYEIKDPDRFGPSRIEHCETVWDASASDMVEMFHTIMIGATYSQECFENALAAYLEERGWTVEPSQSGEETE